MALIIYMEARSESLITQSLITEIVYNRAEQDKRTICEELKHPKSYSWMWDGVSTPIDDKNAYAIALNIAKQTMTHRKLKGYRFFNICKGKKFKTRKKVIKSGKICFY
jgi:spore germination cell wall hydrolase CwlJ-like protein